MRHSRAVRWLIPASLTALISASVAGCSTVAIDESSERQSWVRARDCLKQSVQVVPERAAQMALVCSTVAADPNKTGVESSAAHFNAANAYLKVALRGGYGAICESAKACHETALWHIEQSYDRFSDQQITSVARGQMTESDEAFIARRALTYAGAAFGIAEYEGSATACSTRMECLSRAAAKLDELDLDSNFFTTEDGLGSLACDVLVQRQEVNAQRGPIARNAYIADLQRLSEDCPAIDVDAQNKLGALALITAESATLSFKENLNESGPSASVMNEASDVVRLFQVSAQYESVRSQANRELGKLYRLLATLAPDHTNEYLDLSVAAFDQILVASTSGSVTAEDYEELGVSLLERAQTQLAHGQNGEDDARRSIRVLESAIDLEPSSSRYQHLANAYALAGEVEKAIATARLGLAGLSGAEKQDALISLSKLQDQTGDEDGATESLELALQSGAFNPQVNFELGKRKFDAGGYEAAYAHLGPALEYLSGPQRAETLYMLSVNESVLRKEDWQERAYQYAEQSILIAERPWKYVRQFCLATFMLSDETVKNGENVDHCSDQVSPEGYLLRGMYALKRAQLADVSAYSLTSQNQWRSILREAEASFQRGLDILPLTPEDERSTKFDGLSYTFGLEALLQQGMTVIKRCRRDITIQPGTSAWAELERFYGVYGVLKCSK